MDHSRFVHHQLRANRIRSFQSIKNSTKQERHGITMYNHACDPGYVDLSCVACITVPGHHRPNLKCHACWGNSANMDMRKKKPSKAQHVM
jgi:hypothetical protein